MAKFGREMHQAVEVLRTNLLAIQDRKLDESAQYSGGVPLPSENGKGKIN